MGETIIRWSSNGKTNWGEWGLGGDKTKGRLGVSKVSLKIAINYLTKVYNIYILTLETWQLNSQLASQYELPLHCFGKIFSKFLWRRIHVFANLCW